MAQFNTFRLADSLAAGQNLAMNNYRLSEIEHGVKARQGLTSALRSGSPDEMKSYAQEFPEEAAAHEERQNESQGRQLQRALSQIGLIEKVAGGVSDEATYQRAKSTLQSVGMDVSQFPPNFDPGWVQQQMEQTLGLKGQLEMKLREEEKAFKREQFDETKRHNRATEVTAAAKAAKGKSSSLKAADYNAVSARVADLFGGTYDPMTGRIGGLSKDQSARVTGISERAAQIFQEGEGKVNHISAVAQAAREAGVNVPKVGATEDNAPASDNSGSYQVAPRDPAQRKKGSLYESPKDGKIYKWTGTGWLPAE